MWVPANAHSDADVAGSLGGYDRCELHQRFRNLVLRWRIGDELPERRLAAVQQNSPRSLARGEEAAVAEATVHLQADLADLLRWPVVGEQLIRGPWKEGCRA